MTDSVTWLVGVDWSKSTHQVCLLDLAGNVIAERAFAHGGAGLAELCQWLIEKSGARPVEIAVAIEVPHGPIVETLLERDFLVYAINPKQVDRFRDRFSMAGAKDDRFDAHVMADALRTDRHRLRQLHPSDPTVIDLREWSRIGDELRQERTRLANRISDQLWRYYPQALKLTDDVAADWFLEVWALAPTPAKAAEVTEQSLADILKAHRIRRVSAADALSILREPPIRVAVGTTAAATAHIGLVAVRLKLVNQQLKDVERHLDTLCNQPGQDGSAGPGQPAGAANEPRDATILRSLPGIGRIVLATLLGEGAEPLQRRDYHALRPLCGVAPVTRRSGKTKIVVMRQACHHRLRNAVYHWARVAIQHDEVSRERYAALRKRGQSHGRAIRTVADRLLGVACALLKTRTLFDPQHVAMRPEKGDAPMPATA